MSDLQKLTADINRIVRAGEIFRWFARVAVLLLIGYALMGVWEAIDTSESHDPLNLLLALFAIGVATWPRYRLRPIKEGTASFNLDMKFPKGASPYADAQGQGEQWDQFRTIFKREQTERNVRYASTIVIPALLFAIISSTAPSTLPDAWSTVSSLVNRLTSGAFIRVVEGSGKKDAPETYKLSASQTVEIEVLEENMLEVNLVASKRPGVVYTVELRRVNVVEGEDPVFQAFRLGDEVTAQKTAGEGEEQSTYKITFSATEPVNVVIPSLSKDAVLATVKVKKLPVPKVRLSVATTLGEEPWPDDRPLPLKISARAETPLQAITMLIRTNEKTSRELVANVMNEDKLAIDTTYSLMLEPYIDADFAEVELVAEAVDRSVPDNLIGLSNPIRISTVSAYGRYRQTLNTLRQVKEVMDDSVGKKMERLPNEIKELTDKAVQQSEESPFFDGIDRVHMEQFQTEVNSIAQDFESDRVMQLSSDINDFLFEHEALDDKERDRDFFVAVRGMSRVVEQPVAKRSGSVDAAAERIKKFLDDRERRWKLRVDRLPEQYRPTESARIFSDRPFHSGLDFVAKSSKEDAKRQDALTRLTKMTTEYRNWIENLEKMEEQFREQSEQKRQQGLANARDQLKELQKRQGEISQQLDGAISRPQDDLSAKWPSIKMEQQANLNDTESLENQIRSLSPAAGERIKVALEAMNFTLESGNQKKFGDAESGSDLASRLLRQADSAARKSQKPQPSGRRRRRVTGDGYYGQSIVGGDIEIKRDYQVDQRYREEVLDEVRQSLNDSNDRSSSEDRRFLEDYLRSVIR